MGHPVYKGYLSLIDFWLSTACDNAWRSHTEDQNCAMRCWQTLITPHCTPQNKNIAMLKVVSQTRGKPSGLAAQLHHTNRSLTLSIMCVQCVVRVGEGWGCSVHWGISSLYLGGGGRIIVAEHPQRIDDISPDKSWHPQRIYDIPHCTEDIPQ